MRAHVRRKEKRLIKNIPHTDKQTDKVNIETPLIVVLMERRGHTGKQVQGLASRVRSRLPITQGVEKALHRKKNPHRTENRESELRGPYNRRTDGTPGWSGPTAV